MRRLKKENIGRGAMLRANDVARTDRAVEELSRPVLGGGLAGELVHLALDELAVKPFAAHQQIGPTVLDDLAQLQHYDTVEIPHRGHPVRGSNKPTDRSLQSAGALVCADGGFPRCNESLPYRYQLQQLTRRLSSQRRVLLVAASRRRQALLRNQNLRCNPLRSINDYKVGRWDISRLRL